MTKKDYVLIAEVLKRAKNMESFSHMHLCQIMAFELKKQNPKFNGLMFSKACGYDFNITL